MKSADTVVEPSREGEQGGRGQGRSAGSRELDRLTVPQGLAALSLDALASVAYGPEAIVVVLAAAGSIGLGYTLPVTLAIVLLLGALTFSYRQVIKAFPNVPTGRSSRRSRTAAARTPWPGAISDGASAWSPRPR